MSVSTKQFHETNFLVCHIINILLTLVGYLRESWYRPHEKKFFTLDPRQKPTLHDILRRRPALIKTVCKCQVDSYHEYHIICPPTSFSWDVIALPRERYTFLSKHFYVYRSYLIELMFLELRRCIDLFLLLVGLPPHGSNRSPPC